MPGRRWSATEDSRLMDGIEAGLTYVSIAEQMPGRSRDSVYKRWEHLRERFGDTSRRNATWFADLMGLPRRRAYVVIRHVAAKDGRRRTGGGEWDVSNEALLAFLGDWRYWPLWNIEDIRSPEWRAIACELRGTVQFVTTAEAARRVGYELTVIRQACQRGLVAATLLGRPGFRSSKRWLIREDSLERWYEGKVAA